ncbi:polyprotein [Phytophthora megakarya]|uniref:Polyprotein n=1 Tax=Phytophthora megakarya TaxID=4795 RepID=A0A225WEN5_9STRA|nr:polyprotein [Phytophthora megakarya]
MNAELKAHADNGSWTLVPRTPSARKIGCRWVFAKNRDESGRVAPYKARLVAKGFKQNLGVDVFETYSLVANMTSIRVVLSVVVALEYVTELLDADTAFLNRELKERVYMEVPHGIPNDKNMMCRHDKAIYELNQAVSAWHKTIHRVFVMIGFRICGADECVYVKVKEGRYTYICLYVDGMIIAAKASKEIQEMTVALKSAFKMKELGAAKFILGMGPVSTNKMPRWPDVAYIVPQLSFLENPGQQHRQAAIRVLSNMDDRRSVSGTMKMISEAPVVFKSKYQRTVALSSVEAESMALSQSSGSSQVYEDNQSAIALASNAGYNAMTKHVDIKHHFIRENIARDVINVNYVSTKDQLADMLTKGLGTNRLQYRIDASGVVAKNAHH